MNAFAAAAASEREDVHHDGHCGCSLTFGQGAHAKELQVQTGPIVGRCQSDVAGVAAEQVHVSSDPVEESNLVPDGVIVSGGRLLAPALGSVSGRRFLVVGVGQKSWRKSSGAAPKDPFSSVRSGRVEGERNVEGLRQVERKRPDCRGGARSQGNKSASSLFVDVDLQVGRQPLASDANLRGSEAAKIGLLALEQICLRSSCAAGEEAAKAVAKSRQEEEADR